MSANVLKNATSPKYADVAVLRDMRKVVSTDTTVTGLRFVTENPKRPGTSSFARFAKYSAATSVAEFILLGGKMADLRWDLAHGYAVVSK
jgi:hypothetical protein